MKKLPFLLLCVCCACTHAMAQKAAAPVMHSAPAPLYRDPVTDGAADPVIIWNRQEKSWWMLYTQRRANLDAEDVAYCFGTPIGIASSSDSGQTWVYRGVLNLDISRGVNTYWAPDVVYQLGTYHMFVVYIEGVRTHWGGEAKLAHYTSKNLWDWKFEGFLKLSSENVIDPSLCKMPDGKWRMWYKDQRRNSAIMVAESSDLFHWTYSNKPVIGETAQEGPKIFYFGQWYWMLTDEWHGMRVYRSKDGNAWEKQGLILDSSTTRPDDTPSGAHGDVVVINNKAYVFYFTHPGRKTHGESPAGSNGVVPFDLRRSSIQAGELVVEDGTLKCNRNKPFDFWMPQPKLP